MNLPDYIKQVKQMVGLIRETNQLTIDILVNRIGIYLKEISLLRSSRCQEDQATAQLAIYHTTQQRSQILLMIMKLT